MSPRRNIKARTLLFIIEFVGLIVLLSHVGRTSANERSSFAVNSTNQVIWQLGTEDGTAAEFAAGAKQPSSVSLTSSAAPASLSTQIPSGLNASGNPEFIVRYRLEEVPENGVLFRVNILNAYKSVPQMAVFSNSQMSGLIQIEGSEGTGSAYPFRKSYELYIPKEQLKGGTNELKLMAKRSLYGASSEDALTWWTWDDLRLEKLVAPIDEPIHGSYVLTGTNLNNYEFYYDAGAVRHLPYALKWLGLAYSGNVMRVSCASNVGEACSDIGDYYKVLKAYNMQAAALYLYTGDIKLDPDGTLPAAAEKKLSDYFKQYGSYFQYYEVDNEPGLFNRSKAVDLAVAKWLNTEGKQIAPHLKTVAPGWAYAPAYSVKACQNQTGRVCGTPDGWERDPAQRLELERVTDLTNGHAYGNSYTDKEGGSLPENLKTFGGTVDGFAKPMLTTEFGTADSHKDLAVYGSAYPQSAVFDRIMRAHIGMADMFIQHAAFYKDYSLFKPGYDLAGHNPAKTEVYETKDGGDSRVDIMRRLTLAYATHGKPLSYKIMNTGETANKLVYVRAVDTSALEPLAGSGATSNKLLINFVNFENTAQTIQVNVTMPQQTVYEGERFGSGNTYEKARSFVTGLKAGPQLSFTETLGPGEAVQYILQPSSAVKPVPPTWLIVAEDNNGTGVVLNWLESEGAPGYDILREEDSSGSFQQIASGITATSYTDRQVKSGTRYRYEVKVSGESKTSEPAAISYTGDVELSRDHWTVTSNISRDKSNPAGAIDGNPRTRWDTASNQTPGPYYQIDLNTISRVGRIELDYSKSPYDYPRGYQVEVSLNGNSWQLAATGSGVKEKMEITFPPVDTRYIRITQTGIGGNYWSIHELRLFSGGN